MWLSVKIKVNTSGLDFNVSIMGVKVNCPECQAPNTVTLGQVQREETVTCAECSKVIKLVDKNKSVDKAVSGVNDAMDNLKKALEGLGG
jgi:Zn ribbon nucleic-acid-binding protein